MVAVEEEVVLVLLVPVGLCEGVDGDGSSA